MHNEHRLICILYFTSSKLALLATLLHALPLSLFLSLLRDHPSIETAYVLSVSEQKLSILIPKYGIESTIEIESIQSSLPSSTLEYDDASCSIRFLDASSRQQLLRLQVFQQVRVSIRVEESRIGSRRVVIAFIPNEEAILASIPSSNMTMEEENEVDSEDDKSDERMLKKRKLGLGKGVKKIKKRVKLRKHTISQTNN
jgi:hypothetical protein